jgi:hypothetical protein
MKKAIITFVIAIVVIAFGIFLAIQDSKPVEKNDFAFVPEGSQLLSNLNKAGLEALSAEGTVLHIHQHLDITVNGQDTTIPANIGVGSGFISPLHTHDTTGIVHVESPVQKDFTLGQLFTEWGVRLDSSCVANYCSNSENKLIVGVNGEPIQNPEQHVLKEHDQIHIWYGPATENPELKKTYTFPKGL